MVKAGKRGRAQTAALNTIVEFAAERQGGRGRREGPHCISISKGPQRNKRKRRSGQACQGSLKRTTSHQCHRGGELKQYGRKYEETREGWKDTEEAESSSEIGIVSQLTPTYEQVKEG